MEQGSGGFDSDAEGDVLEAEVQTDVTQIDVTQIDVLEVEVVEAEVLEVEVVEAEVGGAEVGAAELTPTELDIDGSLLDGIEGELADVERALAMLDEGTYGQCEHCGAVIDDDLLARTPTARFCAQHLPLALR